MKRIAVATVLGLVLVACGGNGPSALGPAPSGSPSPSASASPTPSSTPTSSPTPGKPFTFQIWLTRDGKLFETKRTEPFVPSVGQLALSELLTGPNGNEIAASVTTAVTAHGADITALRSGEAAVELRVAPTGVSVVKAAERLPLAQFVYTLTQYSTISSVLFSINGTLLDGRLYSRASFADLLPPIVVASPAIGETVRSPVTISGTADVFEAVVSIRIFDENGKLLVSTFANASCGTGCRGDYSASVKYTVGHQQPGVVEVYEVSAKDGSAINVQDIPVILTP
jgi:hypothetical protein